jgi:hypothetical protein
MYDTLIGMIAIAGNVEPDKPYSVTSGLLYTDDGWQTHRRIRVDTAIN